MVWQSCCDCVRNYRQVMTLSQISGQDFFAWLALEMKDGGDWDQAGIKTVTTFEIILLRTYLMDFCASLVVWMSAKSSLWGVTLDLPCFLERWGWRTNQMRPITSSNGDEKRWNVFDSAEVYNKKQRNACWRCDRCMELNACAYESVCERLLCFFTMPPRQYNFLHGYVNLLQTMHGKAFEPLMWTNIGQR